MKLSKEITSNTSQAAETPPKPKDISFGVVFIFNDFMLITKRRKEEKVKGISHFCVDQGYALMRMQQKDKPFKVVEKIRLSDALVCRLLFFSSPFSTLPQQFLFSFLLLFILTHANDVSCRPWRQYVEIRICIL